MSALFIGIVSLTIPFVIWYGTYRAFYPKANTQTPVDYGKKWFVIAAAIPHLAFGPKFIIHLDMDSFADWIVSLVVLGSIAFCMGWIYGKYKK